MRGVFDFSALAEREADDADGSPAIGLNFEVTGAPFLKKKGRQETLALFPLTFGPLPPLEACGNLGAGNIS